MNVNLEELHQQIALKFQVFQGLSFNDIAYLVGINPQLIKSSKLSTVTLVRQMLEYVKIDNNQLALQLSPLHLSLKTVRLKENGIPKESMSFEQINFMKLVEEQWQTSFLYKKFNESVFLFIVFQYQKIKNEQILFFKGTKVWKMPEETLNGKLRSMWEKTKLIVENGVELTQLKSGNKTVIQNNLPGMNDNPVAHVRPKAKDSNDKTELPDGQLLTKQAYWLNSTYISEILSDLPILIRQKTNQQNQVSNDKIQEYDNLKKQLTNDIYTIEEFHLLAKESLNDYSINDITPIMLDNIDYKIDSHFLLSNQYKDANDYFEQTIFQGNYFQILDHPVFQDSFAKRKLENLENAFRIVQIENNMYITDTCLKQANVQRNTFQSYKNAVESFVGANEFFTLSSLKDSGFYHELDDFGFENLFYESILKRPGRLKYLKLKKNLLFIKTPYPVTSTHLLEAIIGEEPYITIDDFLYELETRWNISIDFDYAISFAKATDYYYSEELEKIFKNKDLYYNYIYR